ncbi:unnamed protein product [Closterium sp. NIES-54]
MRHPSIPRLRAMSSQRLVLGLSLVLPLLPPSLAPPCGPCVEGRLRATPHSSSLRPATEPFETLHLDIWGPAPRPGPERESFFLVVVDDYSHYTTVFPLAKKSEVTSTLIRWLLTTADTRGRRVTCLQSDRGTPHGLGHGDCTHLSDPRPWAPFSVALRGSVRRSPRVSRPEASPISLWTGSPGGASRFRVWACFALVRDTSADKLSPHALPCVFLRFPVDSSDFTFYHPPLHRLFDSRDVLFVESIPYYTCPVKCVTRYPSPLSSPLGASSRGAGVGAESVPVRGPGSGGAGVGAEPVTVGDSSLRGAGVSGAVPGGATTGVAPSAGPGEPGTGPVTSGGAGSGGGAIGPLESGPGATTAPDTTPPPHPYLTRHQARIRRACEEQLDSPEQEQPQQQLQVQEQQQPPQLEEQQSQPQQQQQPPPPPPVSGLWTLGLPSPSPPSSPSPPISGPPLPPPDPSLAVFPPSLPPLSPPLSHTRPSRCSPRARPSSLVPFSDLHTALFCSNYYRTYRPVLSRVSASLVTDPRPSLSSVSALTTAITEFASTRRLDYATSLVAAPSTSHLAVGGESALGCDALEDWQFELEFLTAASPHLCAMLLSHEGDPDALDIPTPRTYAEAVHLRRRGSSPGANVVDGMWIFRVKRPPGSPPVFKVRYVARDFSQREAVDFFQAFGPIPKMTTLWVLQHVAAQLDYELHSFDFSTYFLQGSLHKEVWLRPPSAFTGTFPPGTQWRLRRPVYGLCQVPHEWHDILRSTLAALGFAPSTANPSLFLCTDPSLSPFYTLVNADDLVFATADTMKLALVKSEL